MQKKNYCLERIIDEQNFVRENSETEEGGQRDNNGFFLRNRGKLSSLWSHWRRTSVIKMIKQFQFEERELNKF
jgi:hypothetical protein